MTTKLPFYQVDTFTTQAFAGNPAAIVPLRQWLPDASLQAIAAENNLSETAFGVPAPPDGDGTWHLRWFAPTVEVALRGHAALATAWVMHARTRRDVLAFDTLILTGRCVTVIAGSLHRA